MFAHEQKLISMRAKLELEHKLFTARVPDEIHCGLALEKLSSLDCPPAHYAALPALRSVLDVQSTFFMLAPSVSRARALSRAALDLARAYDRMLPYPTEEAKDAYTTVATHLIRAYQTSVDTGVGAGGGSDILSVLEGTTKEPTRYISQAKVYCQKALRMHLILHGREQAKRNACAELDAMLVRILEHTRSELQSSTQCRQQSRSVDAASA